MVDRGPPAPQPLPVVPATPPAPLVQLPAQQNQSVPPAQLGNKPQLC